MEKIEEYKKRVLKRKFYERETVKVAKDLLGCLVVRIYKGNLLVGRIVEVEAYLEGDKASHAYKGKTRRNEAMFLNKGIAYVFSIYGKHFCFNVVTGKKNKPEAVLIRGVEPLEGIELMKKHRNKEDIRNLTNGPSKFAEAFKIDKSFNKWDLTRGDKLFLTKGWRNEREQIVKTKRIGVDYAEEWKDAKLRFYLKNNPFVSKK